MTRKGGSWASSEKVQQDILDAAQRVFARQGYTRSTMAEIVAEANASIGSIYHHFGDKEGLFFAVADRARDDILAEVDPADFLQSFLRACWPHRHLLPLLTSGDTPATFNARQRCEEALAGFIDVESNADRVVLAILMEAMQMVGECESIFAVRAVAEDVSRWVEAVRATTPEPV